MTRLFVVAWLVLGGALWNGIFDLYVSRGAREYLQLRAEFDAGVGPEPEVGQAMAVARRDGVVFATGWTAAVVGLGLVTLGHRGSARRRTAR